MSWLSKGLKSAGKVLNKAGNVANPAFGFARDVAGGKDLKSAGAAYLGNNADAAKFYGAGASLGVGGGGGLGALGGGGSAASSAGGGGLGGILKSAGGFVMNNPELLLGGLSAIQGSREQAKANEMQKRALQLAEQPWNETAGLRKQSLDQLMNPAEHDLSSLYAGSSNPFARPAPASGFSRLRSVGR